MARFSKRIKYLSEAEIIAINEAVISRFGGIHGIRDLYLLKSTVSRLQTSIGFQDAYKSIFDKAAALFHSLIFNHSFLDGNKRTAFFGAILFLEYNGWRVEFKRKEAVKFTRKVYVEKYTIEQVSKWLKDHSVKIHL